MNININAFYTLSQKRRDLNEQLDILDNQIKEFKEEAKKLKKGSDERKEMMGKANEIENSVEYKVLKAQCQMINYCMNIVF